MLVAVYSDNQYIVDEGRDGMGINARFIDGRVRNRKYCAGYCNSDSHPGYLTNEMVCQHQCGDKECCTFCCEVDFDKEERKSTIKASKRFEKEKNAEREEVLEKCNSIAGEYEGLRMVEASKAGISTWTIKYAAICSVDIESLKREVERAIDSEVKLIPGNYDFDRAAELVFGV